MVKLMTLCAGLVALVAFVLSLFGEAFVGTQAGDTDQSQSRKAVAQLQAELGGLRKEMNAQTEGLQKLDERIDYLTRAVSGKSVIGTGAASRSAIGAQVKAEVQKRWAEIERRRAAGKSRARPLARPPARPLRLVPKPAGKSALTAKPTILTPVLAAPPKPTALTVQKIAKKPTPSKPQDLMRQRWQKRVEQEVKLPPEKARQVGSLIADEFDTIRKIWTENARDGARAKQLAAEARTRTHQKVQAVLTTEQFERFIQWRNPKSSKAHTQSKQKQ